MGGRASPKALRSLNPSIQIRAIPTGTIVYNDQLPVGLSQSLNTDQGNSDCVRPSRIAGCQRSGSLNPSRQIRAIPTLTSTTPKSSSSGRVSIPQYRSGQFRPPAHPATPPSGHAAGLNPSIQIRAIPTYLSKDRIPVPRSLVSIPQYRSGQFRRHTLQVLKGKELSGLFFQPPQWGSFSRLDGLISPALRLCKPLQDSYFAQKSNRCAKMAIWRWRDFCLVWSSVVKERRDRGRLCAWPSPELRVAGRIQDRDGRCGDCPPRGRSGGLSGLAGSAGPARRGGIQRRSTAPFLRSP